MLSVIFLMSGWSPWNLLFGPQPAEENQDSWRHFAEKVVPEKLPQLLTFLKSNGEETISWITRSGEGQTQTISLENSHTLIIETEVFLGSSSEDASTTTQSTHVRMSDTNLDGKMDQIQYHALEDKNYEHQPPFDELSLFLWESGLAITFKMSKCCRD